MIRGFHRPSAGRRGPRQPGPRARRTRPGCEPLEGRQLLTGLSPVMVNPQPLPPGQIVVLHPPNPCMPAAEAHPPDPC
jgi:hypothetical protein